MVGRQFLSTKAPALALLVTALTAPAIDGGGYTGAQRERFAAAALAAALAAIVARPARARAASRNGVVRVLVGLAVLGALSALWSVDPPGDALRWALTTLAYAAIVLAAAVCVDTAGAAIGVAAWSAAVVVLLGVIGLVAAADGSLPHALRESGTWRPASTLEYPPALALAVVCVLPVVVFGLTRRTLAIAAVAAGAGSVGGASLALTGSRTEIVLAVVVGAGLIASRHPRDASRRQIATALGAIAAAGFGARAAAGGFVPAVPVPDGPARVAGLAALVASVTVAWIAIRLAERRRAGVAAALAVAMLALAASVAVDDLHPAAHHHRLHARSTSNYATSDNLLHGRGRLWHAALRAFAERPLAGGGADSFVLVSRPYQGPRVAQYGHDLPLEFAAELGVPGLMLALLLYVAVARALWRARRVAGAWILASAAAAFAVANLVDWPWHLAALGAIWAAAVGGMVGLTVSASGKLNASACASCGSSSA